MKTILIVDDEPDIRAMLAEVLRDEGYRTLVAADGVAAMEVLLREAVDLLVTDTMMPRRGGVELIQSVRASGRLRGLPAILMSAGGWPDLRDLGVLVFLPKPFDLNTLLAAVARGFD